MNDVEHSYYADFRAALDTTDRPNRVIFFADIVGSTDMKEQGEVTWLPTVGKFYDVVHTAVSAQAGRIIKYLGDGCLAIFSDDQAHNAINAAIQVQESLADLRHKKYLFCHCSVALATGKPVEFEVHSSTDYIGSTVDLAARLSAAAAPNSVWADANTISAANMARVTSILGNAKQRGAAGYGGAQESIRIKGLPEPVLYHEIIWSEGPFGVRNSAVTQMIQNESKQDSVPPGRAPVQATPPVQAVAADDTRNWVQGEVKRWDTEKSRGFIRGQDEPRDRFASGFWLAGCETLSRGQLVVFHPRPAIRAEQNDIAVCVVPLDEMIQARVAVLPTNKSYGFVEVQDTNRRPAIGLIFFSKPEDFSGRIGDWLTVQVRCDKKGKPYAQIVTQ